MMIEGAEFRVRGLVQGVGFRPTVWRLATARHLSGEVLNDGDGVLIRAWGDACALYDFETALKTQAPPLARIASVERRPLPARKLTHGFTIAESMGGRITTGVVADAATCPECLKEILDPSNRRYHYAFTNCTHCGPRLSIVKSVPYDRQATSMSSFAMCADCRREYTDPEDRRFHAEPNACPVCGPKVWLETNKGVRLEPPLGSDPIGHAAALIDQGAIIAIKGIGGFHLACDARDTNTVATLRLRKHRYDKPFALMARDVQDIRCYVEMSVEEEGLLRLRSAPIVLLRRRKGARQLAAQVAPTQPGLGFMLPYTPLHHLLMRELDHPIVLTSGNISDVPQYISNDEARLRLSAIADAFLMHDREIVNRLDDSVMMVANSAPMIIRRARGYAPEPLELRHTLGDAPPILAMGAELKSTFCLAGDGRAIVSQHLGDLECVETHSEYRATLDLYRDIFAFKPQIVAIDKHPDYFSSKWGRALAEECGAQVIEVQHHHAHIAATLAEYAEEHGDQAVLGIVLDGLGMGERGELWGGEIMLSRLTGYQRLAAFDAVELIGGDRAAREPWRNAFAHLHRAFGWKAFETGYDANSFATFMRARQTPVLLGMIDAGVNVPPASSAGRLFDAIAAVLGHYPERVSYEGQAAIALEAAAQLRQSDDAAGYPYSIREGQPLRILWRAFWEALLRDMQMGVDPGIIAIRAHRGIARAVVDVASRLRREHDVHTIVLSGGVFQNRLLLETVSAGLKADGAKVLIPRATPVNDGGISLGQAAIAAALSSR
ncbi:MAG: carbamoyltransferase HypF [Hyphomicrobiaceae bacterium]|nr:carbamoyltransferase HypF [Hyphomicrobiaceae bacterium]